MHRRGARVLGDVRPSRTLCRGLKQEAGSIPNIPHNAPNPSVRHTVRPPLDELEELNRVTQQLVNAIDRSRVLPSSGWSHRRSLRGEEKRLENDVRGVAITSRPPTQGQVAWQAASADLNLMDEVEEPQTSDTPALGTFVDIRRGPTPTTGIIVGHALMENQNHILSLSLTGDMLTHTVSDIFFEIPGMVSRELAERAGVTPLPLNKRQISSRVEILKHLREIERRVTQAYTAIGSRNIALYPFVRSSNPNDSATVTVVQAANIIFSPREADSYELLATHRYLMNSVIEFSPHFSSHRTLQTWTVHPQSRVDKLVAVTDMIHQSSPTIDSFVAKARSILAANKRRFVQSWNEPPTQQLASDVRYTPEERMIVEVLHHSLHRRRHIRADPYALVMTTILKKMEVAQVIDSGVLHQVLVDLGHMAPWDDLVSRWPEFDLDQVPDEKSAKVIAQEDILRKHSAKMTTTVSHHDTLRGPEDLYLQDPVEHLRHDFGDLPVYVVDDIGAEELDDGLSIERIPSEPGAAWIHVHIADPTAIIPPTHVFAQEARKIGFTAYFVHRTWPMLPKSLTLSKMSLGSNSLSGRPEPVLTFSFKVDSTGNMTDYKVQAALIRNVITVDYDTVDHLLGSVKNYGASRPFDRPGHSSSRSYAELSAERIDDLRFITETTSRHRQRNLASSSYFYTALSKARVSISPKPLFTTPLDCPDLYQFRGFPSLTYDVVGQQMQSSGSRMVVSECMKTACRVASRWASDHGVPMLRRSSKPPVCLGDSRAIEKLLAIRDPDCHVDFYEVQKAQLYIPPVEHTLEPAMHWSLGIPEGEGYIRVTSPLRRYNDLVAHWQIKHALLGKTTPLFSPTWLTEYAPEIKKKEKEHKRAEKLHLDFWSHLYIKRFLEDPHSPPGHHNPLQSLKATFLRPNGGVTSSNFLCHLPSLGLFGSLSVPSSSEFGIGDSTKVQIKAVELGTLPRIHLVPREK